MTKRILRKPEFWVVVLLVLLAAAAAAEVIYINRTIDGICEALSRVTEAAEAGGNTTAALSDLERTWREKRKILALLIEHDEIDNIDEALVSLSTKVRSRDTDDIPEHAARMELYLRHVVTLTDPALQNIF